MIRSNPVGRRREHRCVDALFQYRNGRIGETAAQRLARAVGCSDWLDCCLLFMVKLNTNDCRNDANNGRNDEPPKPRR